MKLLMIVQGEGRGHLMQAVVLEEMLLRRGHEVVEILVGESSWRTLPGYFNRTVHAPVKRFQSPRLLTTENGGNMRLGKNVLHNLLCTPEYLRSICYINHRIRKTGVDAVINFHEVLTGLTYLFLRPSVPYVAVGREYIFLHSGFQVPVVNPFRLSLMRFYTRLTSLRARKRLALSFRKMEADAVNNVVVVPPLLRREVISLPPEEGDYLLGFLPRLSFVDQVRAFHESQPAVPMRFFWDNPDATEVTRVDKNLVFHQPDDAAFLNALARCRVYAGVAAFDLICEAKFLGKPMLMVPVRWEQVCNAWDAEQSGAGVMQRSFALRPLLDFAGSYTPDREFVYWVRSCERRLLGELEGLMGQPVTEIAFNL